MSQLWVFSIVGDSNVKRNISKTNCRACPAMANTQVLSCQRLQLLDDVLGNVRKESNVCVLSCVTNFLTSSEEDPMVSKRVEPVLEEFASVVVAFCTAAPSLTVLVAPPMYRTSPLWYREGLPSTWPRSQIRIRFRVAVVRAPPRRVVRAQALLLLCSSAVLPCLPAPSPRSTASPPPAPSPRIMDAPATSAMLHPLTHTRTRLRKAAEFDSGFHS